MANRRFLYRATMALTLLAASYAAASPLVFQGQNAALFPGANPADTTALLNSTSKPAPDTAAANAANTASIILSAIQSQISSKIFNDIFGTGAAASGSETLGGGNTISWIPDPNNPGKPQVTITYSNGSSVVVYGSVSGVTR